MFRLDADMPTSYPTRIDSYIAFPSVTTTTNGMATDVLASSTPPAANGPLQTPEIVSPVSIRLPVSQELLVTQLESPPQTPYSPFDLFPLEHLDQGSEIGGEYDIDDEYPDFSNKEVFQQQYDGVADLPEARVLDQASPFTPPADSSVVSRADLSSDIERY
jgi:hypothetical protein